MTKLFDKLSIDCTNVEDNFGYKFNLDLKVFANWIGLAHDQKKDYFLTKILESEGVYGTYTVKSLILFPEYAGLEKNQEKMSCPVLENLLKKLEYGPNDVELKVNGKRNFDNVFTPTYCNYKFYSETVSKTTVKGLFSLMKSNSVRKIKIDLQREAIVE